MNKITMAVAATVALLATGCSSPPETQASNPTPESKPQPTPTLGDATDELADRAAAAGERLDHGELAEFGDLTMTVTAAEWGDEFTSGGIEFRDVHAQVRWENHGDQDAPAELTWLTVDCPRNEDPDDQSSGFHSGPVDVFDNTPPGSFVEGEFTTSAVLPCDDARIVWQPEFDGPMWRWPID